jgi:outer membrane protein assembly factor BamB
MKHLAAILLACLLGPAATAEDWPRWRGPNLNGISSEKGWLQRWPKDGPPVAWKGSVGVGFSTVSVAQGRLYTMGHKDGKDTVHCLDAVSGKPVWSHSYEAELGDLYFDGGPTATPTVHDGRVYTVSRWGDLFCFDAANGKVHWSKSLKKDPNPRVPAWGFACSPFIHDNLLLLNAGKAGLALEKDSGKVVWASAADEEAGYSTPVPFKRGDDWFMVVSSGKAYAAVNIKTGKELWSFRWITTYGVNAADPILAGGDQVFISSGYGKGAALVATGEAKPKEVWRNRSMRNQFNSCVLLDGHLYGIDGDTTMDATLRCLELKTGKVLWTHEGLGSGALMAADGKLIVLSDAGELLLAPVSPKEFKPSARAKVLGGKCWTVPVLANGRIYCRNAAGDLVCVDVRNGK